MATNLSSPTQVRDLLRSLDIQPSRVLGQNFLIDGNLLRILLDLVAPESSDTILEVGPGLGVLTAPLLERAARVVAVEKDPRLHEYLRGRFAGNESFTLIHDDIMEALHARKLLAQTSKVASNLPYSIAGRFLVDISLAVPPPALAVLTVQQEVADRLTAAPGSKAYGALSVFVQTAFRARVHRTVSPSCFYPRPQVQSAIIVLERLGEGARTADPVAGTFRTLVRQAFAQRRKQLAVLLSRAPAALRLEKSETARFLASLKLTEEARPECLAPEQWMALARHIAAHRAGHQPE